MFDIRVTKSTIRKIERFANQLETAKVSLHDFSKPLTRAKKVQANQWRINFNSQGQLYEPWAANWLGENALSDTGTTLAHVDAMNKDGVVTNDAVNWAFYNEHGATAGGWTSPVSHQEGYDNPLPGRKDIPARVIWDFNEDDIERTADELEKYVDDILEKYF